MTILDTVSVAAVLDTHSGRLNFGIAQSASRRGCETPSREITIEIEQGIGEEYVISTAYFADEIELNLRRL
jgi:hypothetical protein